MKQRNKTYILIFSILLSRILLCYGQHSNKTTVCDSLLDSKKYFLAIECYSKQQVDSNTYYNIGVANTKLQMYKEAIEFFNKAIQLNSKDYQAYAGLGYSKFELQKYKESIEDFDIALKINPTYAVAHSYKAVAQFLIDKDTIKALNTCAYALSLNSDSMDKSFCYYNKGYIESYIHNYKSAIDNYSMAIALHNDVYLLAYYKKALCESILEKYEEAISDYTKIINRYPRIHIAYFERGKIELRTNNKADACKDFHKAIEVDCINDCDEIRKLIKKNCKK